MLVLLAAFLALVAATNQCPKVRKKKGEKKKRRAARPLARGMAAREARTVAGSARGERFERASGFFPVSF